MILLLHRVRPILGIMALGLGLVLEVLWVGLLGWIPGAALSLW
jgi:hypothetical protein